MNSMSLEKISNKEIGRSCSLSVGWMIDPIPGFFSRPYEESFCGVREDLIVQIMVYEGKKPIV
jgi:hypothetical protein